MNKSLKWLIISIIVTQFLMFITVIFTFKIGHGYSIFYLFRAEDYPMYWAFRVAYLLILMSLTTSVFAAKCYISNKSLMDIWRYWRPKPSLPKED